MCSTGGLFCFRLLMVLFYLDQDLSNTARDSAAQKAEFAAMIEAAKSRMHQVVYSRILKTILYTLGKGLEKVIEKSLYFKYKDTLICINIGTSVLL